MHKIPLIRPTDGVFTWHYSAGASFLGQAWYLCSVIFVFHSLVQLCLQVYDVVRFCCVCAASVC